MNYTKLLNENYTGTSAFRSRLTQLSKIDGKTGEIASEILDDISTFYGDVYDDKDQNFFDLTDKDDTISFLQTNKLPKEWDEETEPSLPYTLKRSEIKIGRIIRTICKELNIFATDKDIEVFVNHFKATKEKSNIKFKLVKGEEIIPSYKIKNYFSKDKGSLGNSCMNNETKSMYKIYTENPKSVKLLIYIDDNDKIHGRALLWKLNESPCEAKYFMDRVYVHNDSDDLKFKNYAKEKGYLYKKYTSAELETNDVFIYNGKEVKGEIVVILEEAKFKNYPFIDTLCFLDKEFTSLSNKMNKDTPDFTRIGIAGADFFGYILHSVHGDKDKYYDKDSIY